MNVSKINFDPFYAFFNPVYMLKKTWKFFFANFVDKTPSNIYEEKADWLSDWKLHFFWKNNIFRMKRWKIELKLSLDKLFVEVSKKMKKSIQLFLRF